MGDAAEAPPAPFHPPAGSMPALIMLLFLLEAAELQGRCDAVQLLSDDRLSLIHI